MTDRMPRTGGHYDLWRKAGDLVFISGQVPRDADRNIIGQTVAEQTIATLQNVQHVLQCAGCELEDLVKVQVYLADMSSFQEFNSAYAAFMGPCMPVRTTVGAALNGVLVEIDGIARLKS